MDRLTKERRSWNMSRIRGKNTKPELIIRKYLFSKGIRYRINAKLPGKPDVSIKKIRTAIFINGCFWHGHVNCNDSGIPKSNSTFWMTKISTNMARDKRNTEMLRKDGWEVITIWECILNKDKENTLINLKNTLTIKLNKV
jgi:DNA mismatch endonuclease (patch repair protein)